MLILITESISSIAELMEWEQYKMPGAHHHFKKRNRRDKDN